MVAEEQIECYELRLKGLSFQAISTATGLSVGTVYNRVKSEIDARVLPLAEEVRKMELDRLDRYLVRLDEQIEAGRSVARNVEVAVKVSERRSKYLGVDAPEKVEAAVTQVPQDLALAELVRSAKASAAVAEAELREVRS